MQDAQSSRISLYTKADSLLDPSPRDGIVQISHKSGVVHDSQDRPWLSLGYG
jgi:hypothetical protein